MLPSSETTSTEAVPSVSMSKRFSLYPHNSKGSFRTSVTLSSYVTSDGGSSVTTGVSVTVGGSGPFVTSIGSGFGVVVTCPSVIGLDVTWATVFSRHLLEAHSYVFPSLGQSSGTQQ